ncbi:MAG: ABC-2 type transport system ATP-binding protein [Alteromonadaceae bacterium]|jgi:ABC-2 type transport system ATP-binding protein
MSGVNPALQVIDIKKYYGAKNSGAKNTLVKAVDGISFDVEPGEILAFLGPNGAGKTTTLQIASGLVHADAGEVMIGTRAVTESAKVMAGIGSVMEGGRNLYWRLSAKENLEYFGLLKGVKRREIKSRVNELIERFDLHEHANQQLRKLSRGLKQRVAVAASLIHRPQILLLDEPTLGLDSFSTMALSDTISELRGQGIAIVLTTHQLDIAENLSDRIAIVKQGKIIKQAKTVDLIDEFSDQTYIIELDRALGQTQSDDLKLHLNATVDEHKVAFVAQGDDCIYRVMERLRPLQIKSVQRQTASLSNIFLQLTGEIIDA